MNKGPFFLTLNTYRHREHCGPDYDNTVGYRTEKEFNLWKKKDPIKNLKEKLIKKYNFKEKQLDQLSIKLNKSINKAFNFAERSKLPTQDLIKKYIYA